MKRYKHRVVRKIHVISAKISMGHPSKSDMIPSFSCTISATNTLEECSEQDRRARVQQVSAVGDCFAPSLVAQTCDQPSNSTFVPIALPPSCRTPIQARLHPRQPKEVGNVINVDMRSNGAFIFGSFEDGSRRGKKRCLSSIVRCSCDEDLMRLFDV